MTGNTAEGNEPYQRTDMVYGRGGQAVSLPYATPQTIERRMGGNRHIPPTTGVRAVIPYNYTIVDTRTMGSSARLRRVTVGRIQE